MTNVPDYYAILGVQPSATLDEIREAYKKQALISHPDRLPPTATPQEREEATRKFQLIADAYFILGDRTRRESYDKSKSKNKTGFTPFSSAKPNASPNQANQMFGSVFEELLKVEVERPGHLWKILGSGAGLVIGFILANVPGALAVS
ncbi:DnaJ domain-containing protein [Mycotypha africana]|uniref:DnaJ domain-containing protein n=1 Tax=Mycotypha africana TaxID=64632 RepID=UPI002301D223|nr:DnaJ domain-containing protein [Mycotypha africana]KAI8988209.1 DnaJ domain-containing protein [Mycotypha africana]